MKNKAAPKGKDLKNNDLVKVLEEQAMFEEERARNLDELAIYDEMTVGVLGAIKRDLAKGLSSEDIMAKYASVAAARIVTIASTEADSGKALAAAKDILDRVKGKAVERKQIHHKLENVTEKELDAIINTLVGVDDEDEEQS